MPIDIEKVKEYLKKYFREKYYKQHHDYLQTLQRIKLQKVQQMAFEIQRELYYVMQKGNYPFLSSITVQENIRLKNVKPAGNTYLFYYSISAQNTPARSLLQQLQNNINTDIYQKQQMLLYDYGFENACMLYPYIVSGLYILDVQQQGCEIILTVASNYIP